MTNVGHALEQELLSHKIKNFGRPFLSHHYILSLSDLCLKLCLSKNEHSFFQSLNAKQNSSYKVTDIIYLQIMLTKQLISEVMTTVSIQQLPITASLGVPRGRRKIHVKRPLTEPWRRPRGRPRPINKLPYRRPLMHRRSHIYLI